MLTMKIPKMATPRSTSRAWIRSGSAIGPSGAASELTTGAVGSVGGAPAGWACSDSSIMDRLTEFPYVPSGASYRVRRIGCSLT